MTNKDDRLAASNDQKQPDKAQMTAKSSTPEKGPLSFISGAVTSWLFAFVCLLVSRRMVIYFSTHSPVYSSPIAQSIASGLKTLLVGISFLATFSFAFIGLGLFLVFIRSLFVGKEIDSD